LTKLNFFLVVISFAAQAQVVQTARYEIPVYEGTEFKMLPWKENGLILHRRVELEKTDIIQFIKLDTSLQKQWSGSINVSKGISLVFSKCYGSKAYFLFKPRSYFGDFQLFTVNKDSTDNFVFVIKNVIPFNPSMFEVGGQSLIIAGYYNYRPVAIHFSMVTGQTKLLPGFFNDPGELNQLVLNADESIDVVVSTKNLEKKKSLMIMNFSPEGMAMRNTIISPSSGKNLIFGRMVKSGVDTTIVAGVYGKNTEVSRGIFVATITTAGEYTVRYYNFADLKNFFKYLRVAKQNRIKERIDRKKIKGKKIRFNYRIAVHEFIPYEDHYLLLGEAFYPVYKNTGGTYRPAYGRYYLSYPLQRDLSFDGYRYTHAATIGIAKDGRLLWDNSFEIKDVKSYTLNQYVHFLPGKNLALLYSYDNKIITKIIRGTEVIEGKNEDFMKGKFQSDVISKNSTTTHQLEYWYGRYLLSFGVQEVRNTGIPDIPLNRRIFFVNKITLSE